MKSFNVLEDRSPLRWSNLRILANSSLIRLALFAPLIGYLVIFSDALTEELQFQNLTGAESTLLLSTKARLQFLYFGMIGGAFGTLWYGFRCPEQVKVASNSREYATFGVREFSVKKLISTFLHLEKKHNYGRFDDIEYDRDNFNEFIDAVFLAHSLDTELLTEAELEEAIWFSLKDINDPRKAKEQHHEFLAHLLETEFALADKSRKIEAGLLTLLCAFSLICLSIPSVDVFVSVVSDLLKELTGVFSRTAP